jgi:purine-cytosine permease-like protein
MPAASRTARVIGLLVIFAIGTALALAGYKTFLTSFENFINLLLFFFVPWSVINLIDFYIVKKGRYDVRSFFTPVRRLRRLALDGDHPLPARARRAGAFP